MVPQQMQMINLNGDNSEPLPFDDIHNKTIDELIKLGFKTVGTIKTESGKHSASYIPTMDGESKLALREALKGLYSDGQQINSDDEE